MRHACSRCRRRVSRVRLVVMGIAVMGGVRAVVTGVVKVDVSVAGGGVDAVASGAVSVVRVGR